MLCFPTAFILCKKTVSQLIPYLFHKDPLLIINLHQAKSGRRCQHSRLLPVFSVQNRSNFFRSAHPETDLHQCSGQNADHMEQKSVSPKRNPDIRAVLLEQNGLYRADSRFFLFFAEVNAAKSCVPTRYFAAVFIASTSNCCSICHTSRLSNTAGILLL